ncbi:MAG: CBS domain-containing protein [Dehalococcoidia bacterium]|nr:CBS domain-containing protein [Dehalococcoidia bacterium]
MTTKKTAKDGMTRTARDIMTQPVVTANEDMIVTDAIKLLLRWHIYGMPVVDSSGKIVGLITEDDVVNSAFSGNAKDTVVREVMINKVETYSPDMLVEEIVNHFAAGQIRSASVVEGGKIIGIISRRDVIRELNRIYSQF